MNFLAHLSLSDGSAESMIGNMLADFVKGRQILELEPAVARGVVMHRRVDKYIDAHPIAEFSRHRMRPRWGRYSGILIDVFYDHFLAVNWEMYNPQPLRDFLDDAYAKIASYAGPLDPELKALAQGFIDSDRLYSYREVDGIERALERLSRRLKRSHGLQLGDAVVDLREHFEFLDMEFNAFFPHLVEEAAGWRAEP